MNALLFFLAATLPGADPESVKIPRTLDSRVFIELFAAEPDVVTPVGIAIDAKGRVLVVESHTQFRPEGYHGPNADRIRMFEDADGDHHFDKSTTFFEGTRSTMSLAVYHDGSVYVATRSEMFRLRDRDDDGVADKRTPIAPLETANDYRHNGLLGIALNFAGNVYFGLGENLGADYKLIGSDGTTLTGGGDGGKLRRIATGFWNPFHLSHDMFGRLFAVTSFPSQPRNVPICYTGSQAGETIDCQPAGAQGGS